MKYQIDDSNLDARLAAALYQPNATYISPAVIACFITSDDWGKQSLIELKEKTDAYLLVGLQTADSEFEDLGIIDGVIKCRLDEVNDVIKLLDVNAASTLISIDVVDIKSLFESGHSFQFVQASATGESESNLVKVATQQLVSQLVEARHAKGLLVTMESIKSPSLDTLTYISEAIENSLSIDDEFVYYSASITDEPDCFRLRAIYAKV